MFRQDAINTSAILSKTVIRQKFLLAGLGQPLGMFDHVTIHVHHPQGTLRPGSRHHWPTPGIPTGEKIKFCTFHVACGCKRHSLIHDQIMLYQVVKGLTGEGMHGTLGIGKKQAVLIHHTTTGRSKVARLLVTMKTLFLRTGRKDTRIQRRYDQLRGCGVDPHGMASQVSVREHYVPKSTTVLRPIPAAPVIAVSPVLGRSCQWLQFSSIRPKPKIPCAHQKRAKGSLQMIPESITPMVTTGSAINPPIQSPAKPIGPKLLIAGGQASHKNLTSIGDAIAIGILKKENLRSRRHQHTSTPGQDAGRKTELISKKGLLVINLIPIGVANHTHATSRPFGTVHPQRIISHLYHPKTALLIPINRHRILDEGLAHHQFRTKSFSKLHALQRSFRTHWL